MPDAAVKPLLSESVCHSTEVIEFSEDLPPKSFQDLVTKSIETIYPAFFLAKWFWGEPFLWNPKVIRNRMRYYARRYDASHYWRNERPGVHFLETHVEKVFYLLQQQELNWRQTSVLELCGGCGNLGLILKRQGLQDYFLNEKSSLVIRWGKKLFRDYGFSLEATDGDFQQVNAGRKFDIVIALGTENASYSYEDLIVKAVPHQKEGGQLIMSYLDLGEYFVGEWTQYYQKWHGSEFRALKPGCYAIEKADMIKLFEKYGYHMQDIVLSGQTMYGRVFPRYLILGRKGSH